MQAHLNATHGMNVTANVVNHRQLAEFANVRIAEAVAFQEVTEHDVVLSVEGHFEEVREAAERRGCLGAVVVAVEEHRKALVVVEVEGVFVDVLLDGTLWVTGNLCGRLWGDYFHLKMEVQ